jgi:hypothetical protein
MHESLRPELSPRGAGRRRWRRRLAVGSFVSAIAVALSLAVAPSTPATAEPDNAIAGDAIVGVGHFTLGDPDTQGHQIRFAVQAHAGRDGTTVGRFRFRHLLADGELLASGRADVTCLQVSNGTAMFTAVVTSEFVPPERPGLPFGPHAFYVKVIDGDRGPDQVVFAQAIDPPTSLDRGCVDVEDDPRIPEPLVRYPLDRGGYRLRG